MRDSSEVRPETVSNLGQGSDVVSPNIFDESLDAQGLFEMIHTHEPIVVPILPAGAEKHEVSESARTVGKIQQRLGNLRHEVTIEFFCNTKADLFARLRSRER